MRDILIDIFLVVLFLVVTNAIIKGPEIKQNMVEEATTRLETDIKNEETLTDHYVLHDDGKENAVASTAKGVSNGITEIIRMIVIFIGDFVSLMVN